MSSEGEAQSSELHMRSVAWMGLKADTTSGMPRNSPRLLVPGAMGRGKYTRVEDPSGKP